MLGIQQFYRSAFDSLNESLDNLPVDDSDLTISTNLALIELLGTPSVITHIINIVLENKALLRAVSTRSYRHINEFDKIVLVGNDSVNRYRLTLHIWGHERSTESETPELMHDHRFDLWSSVLTGVLESENYIESIEGTKYRNYRYTPEKRNEAFTDFYKYEGDTHLARVEKTRLLAGQSYYLRTPSIHQVIKQKSGLTCTLVLRGPRKRTYANIYNTQYPQRDNKFNNRMFSPPQVQMKLELIMSEMQANFLEMR